jgi:hypothetical protein
VPDIRNAGLQRIFDIIASTMESAYGFLSLRQFGGPAQQKQKVAPGTC